MKLLKILLYLFIIINFILIGFLFSQHTGKVIYDIEKANITRVIDGDTIETDLGKVRLLGINTPEKNKKGYEEAKIYLQQFEGKEVDLIRTKENKDKYGRLLRYVFYYGKNINLEIVESGLGHLYIYDKDDFSEKLKKSEEIARKKEIGIWEKSEDKCSGCIKLVELNHIDPGEYVLLENICNFNCDLDRWTIKDDATHLTVLDFEIKSKEKKKIDYEGRVWNDVGDTLYLRDNSGLLVIFYRY